jgi:hypothetical protein
MTRTKYKWALASAVLAAGVSITGGWALGFAQQPAPEGPALAVPKPERQAAARDTPPSLTFPVRAEAAAGAAPEDKSREASALQRAYSQRNLRQIALAVLAYQKEHGCLPTDILDKDGKPLLSWRVAVLPYMEQKALYRLFKLDEPWDSEANKFLLNTILKLYANALENPLDAKGVFVTRVKRFTGANTLHQPGKNIDVNVTPDGIANTLLLAEVGDPVPWTKPGDPVIESVPDKLFTPKDPPVWKGPYTNVVNVAFADGVAASLKPDLTQEIVARLIYWNDGMALPGREGLEAVIPAAQQEEEIKNALLKLKQLADSYQAMCEEESKLLGEIGKLKKDPPDAAARLSERLMDLDVNLRNLTNEVRSLQTQIEKLKNEKK